MPHAARRGPLRHAGIAEAREGGERTQAAARSAFRRFLGQAVDSNRNGRLPEPSGDSNTAIFDLSGRPRSASAAEWATIAEAPRRFGDRRAGPGPLPLPVRPPTPPPVSR